MTPSAGPIRVVHVINSLTYGGAETRTLSVVNALDRRRFQPVIVYLKADTSLAQHVATDVPLVGLDLTSGRDLWRGMTQLWRILRRIRPTIVHTHLVQASLIARMAAKTVGVPLVISTQHNAFYPKQNTLVHRLERHTWRWSHSMIALSEAIETHLRDYGYRGPVRVIPTGVDVKAIKKCAEQSSSLPFPYVLSVGHFRDGQKGHDILLRAFASIAESRPEIKLVIAGDGPNRMKIAQIANQLGLQDAVMFLGNRDDIPGLMSGCTVFALASRWEGFGRVLVEAMALGCPIVATNVEGIPEVVRHNNTGILVSPEQPRALGEAIELLLSKGHVAARMQENAKLWVAEHFSLTQMVEEVSAFYESLLRPMR